MVGQRYGYKEPRIVKVHDTGTTTDWEVNDTVTDKITPAKSNPFGTNYPYINDAKAGYDKVGQQWEVLAIGGDDELPSIDTSDALIFAEETQISDISHYRDFVDKSNRSEPENEIVYVNEVQANAVTPHYENMTLAGLSLRASRNFTRLDQAALLDQERHGCGTAASKQAASLWRHQRHWPKQLVHRSGLFLDDRSSCWRGWLACDEQRSRCGLLD